MVELIITAVVLFLAGAMRLLSAANCLPLTDVLVSRKFEQLEERQGIVNTTGSLDRSFLDISDSLSLPPFCLCLCERDRKKRKECVVAVVPAAAALSRLLFITTLLPQNIVWGTNFSSGAYLHFLRETLSGS